LRICTEPIEPAARNHLAARARGAACAVLPPAHGCGSGAIELDLFDQAIKFDAQVGTLEHRFEKGARCRPAPPALLIDVEQAAALVVAGVEIGNALDARLLCCRAERIEDVPAHARALDAQFAADRVRSLAPRK
jgi:hypothetical protein